MQTETQLDRRLAVGSPRQCWWSISHVTYPTGSSTESMTIVTNRQTEGKTDWHDRCWVRGPFQFSRNWTSRQTDKQKQTDNKTPKAASQRKTDWHDEVLGQPPHAGVPSQHGSQLNQQADRQTDNKTSNAASWGKTDPLANGNGFLLSWFSPHHTRSTAESGDRQTNREA